MQQTLKQIKNGITAVKGEVVELATIDTVTVNELAIYAQNTSYIYERIHLPYVRLYRNKINKGIYNEELAIKGIYNNYVKLVISEYDREFGLGKLDKVTKRALAREILNQVINDINEGVN